MPINFVLNFKLMKKKSMCCGYKSLKTIDIDRDNYNLQMIHILKTNLSVTKIYNLEYLSSPI